MRLLLLGWVQEEGPEIWADGGHCAPAAVIWETQC